MESERGAVLNEENAHVGLPQLAWLVLGHQPQ